MAKSKRKKRDRVRKNYGRRADYAAAKSAKNGII